MPSRSRTFSSTPEASAAARGFVRDEAAGSLARDSLDDVLLLTTELVTNAIRHAGEDPLEVSVSIEEGSVKVVVRDTGRGFVPGAHAGKEPGGWGLDLVQGLASSWGVDIGEQGTDVWFEIESGS